jgi:uncharacterized delta-60 repeat protein
MNFFSWLRKAMAFDRTVSGLRRPRHSRCRPSLEGLEDRCLLSGGVLDPTFGTRGIVTTQAGSFNSGDDAVATYPATGTANDGKVVAAGSAVNGYRSKQPNYDFAVVRYNLDGTPDPSFGGTGVVTTDLGSWLDLAADVKVQPDGKVVVAGTTYVGGSSGNNFALVRYNADGTLDTSFGSKGEVLTDFSRGDDTGYSLALQRDGKIILAGKTVTTTNADLAVARYNSNGTLDTSFGTGGKMTLHFALPIQSSSGRTVDLALDPGTGPLDPNAGKLVLVTELSDTETVLARLNPNGTPETSFGGSGTGYLTFTTLQDPVVAVQADDRILVAGGAGSLGLARFNPDGTPDSAFGVGGLVVTSFPDAPESVVLQPDGSILVAGKQIPVSSGGNLMVVRCNADNGSLDTSFGTNGVAATTGDLFYGNAAMALEPDGRIVLADESEHFNPYDFALARFLATGPQVGSFTSSSTSVPAGSNLTLTAGIINDANPGASVTQVEFYYYVGGNKVTLGTVTQLTAGAWTLTSQKAFGLTTGTYTIYAQAEDSYGVCGDPVSLTLTVS